ncbi:hypothetical protein EDC01DRAFT_663307 [Geopyxis carbonaria]|nr:hypothetical protein EDC01DRAFT_663307 [Geopyxis carbonaria]
MATIASLPSELLVLIFRHVGATHYRSDLSRLAVCRRWYPLARIVLFSHLTLHTRTLLDPAFPGAALAFLQSTTQAVTIRLTDVFNTRAQAADAAWELHRALSALARALAGFRGLRSVELKAGYRIDERDLFQPRVDYLRAVTMGALMDGVLGAGATLTTLVLDTSGSEFVRDEAGGGGELHVCEVLARRAPLLRRCWLTMRRICPEVFRFGEHGPEGGRLESLVVCLSLDSSWFRSHVEYSNRCNPSANAWELVRRVPGWTLLEELVTAFDGVRESLPRLKVGRVVCNRFPGMERVAVDLITGKRVRLREGAEMEDEGETEDELGQYNDDEWNGYAKPYW